MEDIFAWTMLGIYTGTLLAENETNSYSKDIEAELKWLKEQSAGDLNKFDDYSFDIKLNENEGLCVSGFGRGNILLKINANSTYALGKSPMQKAIEYGDHDICVLLTREDDIQERANVRSLQMRYKNGAPFIALWSTEHIKKDQELLIDYGHSYWKEHEENYTKLSRPDAPIFQDYLKNNPDGLCFPFPSFLRRRYPEAYREIKTEGPASPEKTIPLDLEDRIVHVIGIDDASSSMRLYAEYDNETMLELQQNYDVTYEKDSCHPFYSLSGKKAEGAVALSKPLKKNTPTKSTELGRDNIGSSGAAALAEALAKNDTITNIDLRFNNIGTSGAEVLAKALEKNETITSIDLLYNYIGTSGAEVLAKALEKNNTITSIGLGGNDIGFAGVEALVKALEKNKTITKIDLFSNNIGNAGAKALAKALEKNNTITSIGLVVNKIGNAGVKALAKALEKNNTITFIGLGFNNISSSGAAALAEALEKNKTITKIDLVGENYIGAKTIERLSALCVRKNILFY